MSQIVCFVLYPMLLGSSFFPDFAGATNSWVYPSEYAYRDDTVTRTESISANCRRYPPRDVDKGITYTHCNGQQLKLSDSDRGSNTEYTVTSYYVWSTGSDGQLLFILHEGVWTNITLHYYSDSVRGRPRLRFYAVSDDFDIWDAVTSGIPYVGAASVPPGGEPAGRRNVSINVNFNTKRILMYKFSSSFQFAVSEVEFFRCTVTTSVTTTLSVISMTTATKNDHASTKMKDVTIIISNTTMEQDAKTSQATTARSQTHGALQPPAMVAVGVVGVLLLILITSLIVILILIMRYRKRTRKLEIDPNSAGSMREDASYSILERGRRQQIQPQDSNSTELYDQIHLSPSTGQTELISKTESETARDSSVPQSNIYSNADMENQTESQPISSYEPEKSTLEDATYAVVDKKKKKKKSKGASHDKANKKEKIEEEVKVQEQPSLDDMYAVVHKKPKKSKEQGETPPPIPASTVESLYTAIQKTP